MEPVTLLELNNRLGRAIAAQANLRDVWVAAETSDLRTSGGHCYLELIQKDPSSGRAVARARAVIWASTFSRINAEFCRATGTWLRSDIKILVKATVTFHVLYGLSLTVSEVDPAYTLGDLMRRRREMVARLKADGILDMNRSLAWPQVALRIAVISARGAAGYGDFINQLYSNRQRLRFRTKLFPAVMQGESAPASIIGALEAIAGGGEVFDCVVLIRGGGATGDLAAFDDYALAANIAQFPLPVVIGIGHERDVTLLDYVANMRVKTPTAAAEWLIGRGTDALEHLHALGGEILEEASRLISQQRQRIAVAEGELPALATGAIERRREQVGSRVAELLAQKVEAALSASARRLDALSDLAAALSPEATLRRGFSITRDIAGSAITSASMLKPGQTILTTLADGTVKSKTI